MTKTLKNTCRVTVALLALATLSSPALSAAGSTATLSVSAGTFVTGITTVLNLLGIGIATIAVFIFGYQVGFTGKSAAQAAPILIGGFIIGAATSIGGAMVGNTAAGYGTSLTTKNIVLPSSEAIAINMVNSNTLFEITPSKSVI